MGTRGLTGFIADGKWYATYNHFDSYPEGLGQEVLEFCKTVEDWDKVKELVKGVTLVTDETRATAEDIQRYYNYSDLSVSGRSPDEWYCLLRELQGVGILEAIANDKCWHMIDSHKFIGDSLFCEWAYIIDLDDMALRVYKGFQNTAHTDNILPADVPYGTFDKGEYEGANTYYPCKHLFAYDLNALPEFMLGVSNEFKAQYKKALPSG